MASETQPLLSTRPEYRRNSTVQKPSLGYAVLLLFIAQVFQGAKGLWFPLALRASLSTRHFRRSDIGWLCYDAPPLVPLLVFADG